MSSNTDQSINDSAIEAIVRVKSYSLLDENQTKVPIDCIAINSQQHCFRNNFNAELLSNCDNSMKEREDLPICRICHCNDDSELITMISNTTKLANSVSTGGDLMSSDESICASTTTTLITPCYCSGSLRYVHHYCLQQWIRSSNHKYCELCKYHFKLTVKSKPLHKWQSLDMSASERRKLVCNLIFNMISMFCVFWSIYVLIERATIEARYGLLDWPFWTKMLVVTIGFLGGTVFLFVQLRLYISILIRWRQFNRIIIIENIPIKESITISTISSSQTD